MTRQTLEVLLTRSTLHHNRQASSRIVGYETTGSSCFIRCIRFILTGVLGILLLLLYALDVCGLSKWYVAFNNKTLVHKNI